ncbi:MAG: lipid-A-disaccharide synthase [Lewinellaceae bacterium]|nr:lipid-A-disaccharide synthase [Lewinellaceae bacterium]
MKYYLIAGEASGDLHGSNLMKSLSGEDPGARFRVWGGDLMENAGGELVKHYRDLAFMGFLEVVKNLPTIFRNIRFCKADILAFQPEALILIDYPGFNLRIAEWAAGQGIRVFYYISPQLWAWHASRVKIIQASVERMFTILPFETEFYKKYQYEVSYVGHPLLDVVAAFTPAPDFRQRNQLPNAPLIALLPGSRKQEISRMLRVMLESIPLFPENYHFAIAGAPAIEAVFYEEILRQHPKAPAERITVLYRQTYDLLHEAVAAAVTSGTATLETALFGVPQVVCYRGNALSFQIAKRLVKVPFISLVNLVAGKEIVRELIQHQLTPDAIADALLPLLPDNPERARMKAAYEALQKKLGGAGASKRTAKEIIALLSNSLFND